VQIGRKRLPVVAREATAEEKARLWPQLVAMYPDYAVYQTRTDRQIPVVILSPA
jgi:deazaflavin-dependent oxidoreductase (nitroreductase family)